MAYQCESIIFAKYSTRRCVCSPFDRSLNHILSRLIDLRLLHFQQCCNCTCHERRKVNAFYAKEIMFEEYRDERTNVWPPAKPVAVEPGRLTSHIPEYAALSGGLRSRRGMRLKTLRIFLRRCVPRGCRCDQLQRFVAPGLVLDLVTC